MQLKKVMNIAAHGFCLLTIAVLTVFIFHEEMNDRHGLVQKELRFSFVHGSEALKNRSDRIMEWYALEVIKFPGKPGVEYLNRAKRCTFQRDSIIFLLDSLINHPTGELLYDVQGKLHVYRSRILEAANFDKTIDERLPKFSRPDWLSQAWTTHSVEEFAIVLEKEKARVALMAEIVIIYCVGYIDKCWFGRTFSPEISINQIFPKTGEEITADILLNLTTKPKNLTFKLNNQALHAENSVAQFKVKFDTPGVYPLRFSVERYFWETDSVQVGEKTYFVRVR